MEVGEQDGGFRAGDDQNEEHNEQEAEHIEHLKMGIYQKQKLNC